MNECPVEISFCIEEVQQRLSGFIGSPERSNISAYHEVKKGDLLARVVFAADDEEADKADEVNARKETESSVEERVIDEEEVLPDFFKVNDGVELLKKSQYIFEYIAQKNGLVHFKPDEISLTSDV
ncbi:MAG: hypothetical protein HRT88_00720 [Lentisphaeraceae bacterium]|nr:hypothetical protein [Lentisphaeraceae bacterium]